MEYTLPWDLEFKLPSTIEIFCREYDISWWEFLIRKTIEYQWEGVCFYFCSRPVRQRAIPLAAVVLGNAPTFGSVSLSLTRGRNRTLQSTEKSRGSFSTEALVPSRAGKSQADFMPRPDTFKRVRPDFTCVKISRRMMMAESTNLVALVLNHRFILVFFGGHRNAIVMALYGVLVWDPFLI